MLISMAHGASPETPRLTHLRCMYIYIYIYIHIYIHTPFSVDLTNYILCVVHYSLYVDFVQYTSQILRSASIAYSSRIPKPSRA